MTDNDAIKQSGEDLFRTKRRKFWRYLILAFAGFMILGFVGGYAQAAYDDGDLPIAVPIIAVILTMSGLSWFTWDYFRRIDELDLMDNLWASLIGQYVALFTFMTWYFLGELDLTGYPTALGIIIVMMFSTFAAYGARKLGWR